MLLQYSNKEKGFTLIEIMIVIAIIGIIAAIAVPNYNNYRQKALKQQVISAVRGVASLEEAHFASNQVYYAFAPATGPVTVAFPGTKSSIRISPSITISATIQPDTSLKIDASHPGVVTPISYSTLVGVVL